MNLSVMCRLCNQFLLAQDEGWNEQKLVKQFTEGLSDEKLIHQEMVYSNPTLFGAILQT